MKERRRDLAEDIELVLNALSKYGFTPYISGAEILEKFPVITGDDFARMLMIAEGWDDPNYADDWYIALKNMFTQRYGEKISIKSYADWDFWEE